MMAKLDGHSTLAGELYHESLNIVQPVDAYEGRSEKVLDRREEIKRWALQLRQQLNPRSAKTVS